jgi:hypothetical protein
MAVNDAGRAGETGIDLDGYCRAVEAHLCRRNDGHLIRIAGPTFDLVRGWAEQGVPLKVALAGIDRTFERYYRKGARRRPLQVSFCDADVLDAFDDWRRALGLTRGIDPAPGGVTPIPAATPGGTGDEPERPGRIASLPSHLERVANRLTLLRGDPRNDAAMEAALSAAVLEMDSHRRAARQARGSARAALIARLGTLDDELLSLVRRRLAAEQLERLAGEAADALAPFRERMPREAYAAAHQAALTRVLREHAGLPVIRYDSGI